LAISVLVHLCLSIRLSTCDDDVYFYFSLHITHCSCRYIAVLNFITRYHQLLSFQSYFSVLYHLWQQPQQSWVHSLNWRGADEAVLKKSLFCLGSVQRFSTQHICVSVAVLVSEGIHCLIWYGKLSIFQTAGHFSKLWILSCFTGKLIATLRSWSPTLCCACETRIRRFD